MQVKGIKLDEKWKLSKLNVSKSYKIISLPGILYVAPEIRLSNENNKNRRVDQNWIAQVHPVIIQIFYQPRKF